MHGGPAHGWARWLLDGNETEGLFARLSARDGTTHGRLVGFDHTAKALRRRGGDIDGLIRAFLDRRISVIGVDPGAQGLSACGLQEPGSMLSAGKWRRAIT